VPEFESPFAVQLVSVVEQNALSGDVQGVPLRTL